MQLSMVMEKRLIPVAMTRDLAAEFGYGSDGPNDFSDGMDTDSDQNSPNNASTDVSSIDDESSEGDSSTSSSNGTSCKSDCRGGQ